VENGQEVRPHHYIRSILPEGPVGQNGTLRSGDELLEVIQFPYLSAARPKESVDSLEIYSVEKAAQRHSASLTRE